MAAQRQFKILKVTSVKVYMVEEPIRCTTEELIKDWFYNPRYPMGSFHAYRDQSQLGNFEHAEKVEEVSVEEFKQYVDSKK